MELKKIICFLKPNNCKYKGLKGVEGVRANSIQIYKLYSLFIFCFSI
jgi:hypothetical protein